MNASLTDLDSCATQPIRVPGAIQPHGRMLVLDARNGVEVAHSANWPGAEERAAALAMLISIILAVTRKFCASSVSTRTTLPPAY